MCLQGGSFECNEGGEEKPVYCVGGGGGVAHKDTNYIIRIFSLFLCNGKYVYVFVPTAYLYPCLIKKTGLKKHVTL